MPARVSTGDRDAVLQDRYDGVGCLGGKCGTVHWTERRMSVLVCGFYDVCTRLPCVAWSLY